MGITIVQKSDLKKRSAGAPKALILAGGAVTGGSFKAGGIKALNDHFKNFSVNNFDIYVGISSGSMLAAALMAGISPESILKSLDGTSAKFTPLSAWHYYKPNFSELFGRPVKFMIQAISYLPDLFMKVAENYPEWSKGILGGVFDFIKDPSYSSYDRLMQPIINIAGSGNFPSLLKLLPSGIFDNRMIEAYIRHNIERGGLTNDFKEAYRLTKKKLFISAMRLDGARRVVFGVGENLDLTISQAVQASTALPGFYMPACIHGVDYVDGGVQDTADIDIAVSKGAKLVICYNPFRPYEAKEFVEGMAERTRHGKKLAADGVATVLNQILRAFFHSRLKVALDRFRTDPKFTGDIILIEPRADDLKFFTLNPLFLKNRVEAAMLGYRSACNSIEERYEEIEEILGAYEIKLDRKAAALKIKKFSSGNFSETEVQSFLEGRKGSPPKRMRRKRKK